MILRDKFLKLLIVTPFLTIIHVYGFNNAFHHPMNLHNMYSNHKNRHTVTTMSESHNNIIPSTTMNRRELLKSTAFTTTILSSSHPNPTQAKELNQFTTFQINPDPNTLSPSLTSLNSIDLIEILSCNNGAIWLGEHHNSLNDHILQSSVIGNVYNRREGGDVAIGLEMVQLKFQDVLDAYVCKEIGEKSMLDQVQWESRWSWPFEVYRPIFELAREKGIRLLALNVNSEDLELVEFGGYPALGKEKLKSYISDPKGFATLASSESFKEYVNYVITPSYTMHKQMGILKDKNMPFERFLSGRLLWDETMACTAAKWCTENPNGILFGCVGLDHVKFVNGIPARFLRMCDSKSISLLLNPTLTDTRPPGSVSLVDNNQYGADRITLQLRYEDGGVLPLADYLVLS